MSTALTRRYILLFFFFFFSSRRRHTRFDCDWSSDVCSSDLSLHTLVEGLSAVPPGAVFCTMVDTVMRPEDWQAVYRGTERHLAEGADMVLAVTPHVDDESPVYVSRQAGGFVLAVSDEPISPACVTGGAYRVSAAAPPPAIHPVRGRARKRRPVPS